MFFSIALSRVFPVLFSEPSGVDPMDERTYKPFLDRLAMLAQTADREGTLTCSFTKVSFNHSHWRLASVENDSYGIARNARLKIDIDI